MTTSVRRAWHIYALAGLLGLAGYLLLPLDELGQSLYYDAFALATVVAIVVGVRLYRPRRVGCWLLIAAAELLWVSGDSVWTVHTFTGTEIAFPSVADVLYLAGYPVLAAGLILLVRAREPVGNRAALIDASIVGLGAALLYWLVLASPYVEDSSLGVAGSMVATAYPAGDALLLAVCLRLLFGSPRGRSSFRFLILGLLVLLVVDTVYGVLELKGLYTEQDVLDIWWLVSYFALGAGAMHPSMRSLSEPVQIDQRRPSRWRLPLLAVATLAAPAILLVQAARGELRYVPVIAGVSALLFALVVLRMHWLIQDGRRAAEVEHRALGELQSVDEMKTAFLHAVSHELRTPLTAILGTAVTLERGADVGLSLEEEQLLLTRLAANARKLDRLLSDLLDLDRLDRGAIHPRRAAVDVGALVRRVVDELSVPSQRQVSVSARPVTVAVESAQVERIVENLVLNALRHTSEDAPVWVRVEPSGGGVLIAVEDAGPGVPDGIKQAIFEPFSRGRHAVAHAPGVGIGLSLVTRFARLHGGRAWVQDRPGGGSSFRVWLPAGDPASGPDAARDDRPVEGRGSRPREASPAHP